MSPIPPSGTRPLAKKSRCPSMEMVGAMSVLAVLMGDPRFTAAAQGQSPQVRWDTQMSVSPSPPARSEVKYRLSPSGDSVGLFSLDAVLIAGPRFAGSDHSELAKDMVWSLIATGSCSDPQATITASDTGCTSLAIDAVLIGPPPERSVGVETSLPP